MARKKHLVEMPKVEKGKVGKGHVEKPKVEKPSNGMGSKAKADGFAALTKGANKAAHRRKRNIGRS